jgi:hypothetical protein
MMVMLMIMAVINDHSSENNHADNGNVNSDDEESHVCDDDLWG